MTITSLYQGDTSDIFSVAVFSEEEQVVGSDLDDFAGKFTVMKKLGDAPLLEKNMVVVDDNFQSSIAPEESEALAVGNYLGVIEITNTGLTYRKESHINIKILKQGFVD